MESALIETLRADAVAARLDELGYELSPPPAHLGSAAS